MRIVSDQQSSLEAAWRTALEYRDHLLLVPSHMDFGTPEQPPLQSPVVQLIFLVDRQNYISFLSCLETDHVIPATQLTRSLLEESIRWSG